MKSLSICIPTYNRLEVFALLESLSLLLSSQVKAIVSDNSSSIYTENELKTRVREISPNIIAVRQVFNLGYSGNMLSLIELADTEWTTFLMSDDKIILPAYVELLDGIKENDSVVFANGLSTHECGNFKNKFVDLIASLASQLKVLIFRIYSNSCGPSKQIKFDKMNCLWQSFNFLPFPALPNALFVRTKLLQSILRSDEFNLIYPYIEQSGHALDFLILFLSCKQATNLRIYFKPIYILIKHSSNGQIRLKRQPLFTTQLDRFILRTISPYNCLLVRLMIIFRLISLLPSILVKFNLSYYCMYIRFFCRELALSFTQDNPRPTVTFK